jgi:hypothetical protein
VRSGQLGELLAVGLRERARDRIPVQQRALLEEQFFGLARPDQRE